MDLAKPTQFFESLGIPFPTRKRSWPDARNVLGACSYWSVLASRLVSIPLMILLTVAYLTADSDRARAILSDPDKFVTADEFLFLRGRHHLRFRAGRVFARCAHPEIFETRGDEWEPMNSLLNAGKILAIQLFFGMTFFLAATLKWRLGVTPEFSPTVWPDLAGSSPWRLARRLLFSRGDGVDRRPGIAR